jgi:hypothetical protein
MISFEEANDPLNEGHVNMVRAMDWIVKHLDGDLVFLAPYEWKELLRFRPPIELPRELMRSAAAPARRGRPAG